MGRARVIAINDAVRLAPWADLLYFCDEQWYRWHETEVREFEGMKATLENFALRDEVPGLACLAKRGEAGLCAEPDGLHTGSNSGFQAINLAVHLGARKIVLLGYDMKAKAGQAHWFGDHPVPTVKTLWKDLFIPAFRTLADPLKRRGVEVVNATPDSALDVFPFSPLREALCS